MQLASPQVYLLLPPRRLFYRSTSRKSRRRCCRPILAVRHVTIRELC
ncbi:hypothetical protein I553_8913 [Mycobacterium xenopi 4042]|uniref:Uncharacterized protein n=1 Tax=Mycobacterium xenopi 4042 TaxID=1299334 RepID=X8CLA4_MYCXE|nr:hypothetical protein I553_8913 [Mycobacterium xenopi 4042]